MEINQKSNLAKLLATENLSVEHQNVSTAAFDLKARKVILPRWVEMAPELYDLFIGHEVSHGLETPPEGWHTATCNRGGGFKSFLNVIEDARIEKLVKLRYPGLVKSFAKGYDILLKKDFFGLKNTEISDLPLIDRINLHFKGGSMLAVPFSAEEMPFVDAVAKCNTWDEVVELAESLFEHSKSEEAMQNQMQPEDDLFDDADDAEYSDDGYSDDVSEPWDDPETGEESDVDEDGESSDEDGEDGEDGESSEETDTSNATTGEESEESEESDETSTEKTSDGNIMKGSSDGSLEPEAMTDTNFRAREKELIKTDGLETLNVTWPKLITKKLVMPCAEVWDFETTYNEYGGPKYTPAEAENILLKRFQTKHKTTINQLVQQFEMKRKATAIKKQRINSTGKLNEDKLWAYKLTDDLFLSSTTVPDGQNHGMLMLLDMSGSMYQQMKSTIEQLMIQIAFCKKVNIPFKVYGFSSCTNSYQTRWSDLIRDPKVGDIHWDDVQVGLVELITSDLGAAQYTKVFKKLLGYATVFGNYYRNNDYDNVVEMDRGCAPRHLNLGMTPLAEGIMILRDIAIEFKESKSLEVLNTIILTDGDNSTTLETIGEIKEFDDGHRYAMSERYYGKKFSDVFIKEGPVTTAIKSESGYGAPAPRYNNFSNAMMKHYQATTGSRMIGFRLVEPSVKKARDQFMNAVEGYDWDAFDKAKKTWASDRFIEVPNATAYDALYLIKGGKGLDVEETELEVKSTSKGDLRRGFKKFAMSKSSSRVFLNRFIEKVA
tara:strand:- start:4466 stop:6787 length:2322 start_codon:yes stop_codon:yes gene_type:complete